MNFLPKELEDLINDYKYQMEHKERMDKLNKEFHNRYKYFGITMYDNKKRKKVGYCRHTTIHYFISPFRRTEIIDLGLFMEVITYDKGFSIMNTTHIIIGEGYKTIINIF